jgi:hypothetical protein
MADTTTIAGVTAASNLSPAENANPEFANILKKAQEKYGYIDAIFSTDDELREFLIRAITGDMSPVQFERELTSKKWFIANADTVRARDFFRRQYDNLIKGLDPSDPDYDKKVQAAVGNTDYARGLQTAKDNLEYQLNSKGITYTPAELNTWARDIYDSANEKNTAYIAKYLNAKIKVGDGTPKGAIATNISDLQDYANDYGFELDKDFTKSQVSTWMQRLDRGESLDAVKAEIKQAALVGQTEQVQKLMNQGLTLRTIYQPYVNRMNSRLQKTNITMKDDWLMKNMFDEKGNLRPIWDFDRATAQHPDFAFTDEAIEKSTSTVLRILQDFGLQGR